MSGTFLTFYKKALKANEGNEAFLTAGYLILTLAMFNFMCRNDDLRFNTKEYIYEQTQQRKMIMSSNNLFYKTFNRLAKPVPFIESITPQQAGSKWYLVRSALVQQITENKFKLLMLANCNLFERLVYDTCRSDSDESNFSLTAMMLIFKIYVFALLMTKASLLDDTLMEPGRAIERHKNFRKVLLDIMEPICDGVVKVWETLAELRNNAKVNHAATVEEIIVDIGQSNVELESENDKLQAEIDKLQAQSKSSEMEIPVEVKTASISKTTSSNDNESEDMKAELSLRRRRSYG